MNFINRMRTMVTQYHINHRIHPSPMTRSWRIRIERRFLDETDEKGYWLFRLMGGFHHHVFFQKERLTVENCFRSTEDSSGMFPETDMGWLTEIAGFLSRFEKDGAVLTILPFGNGNGQVLFLSAKFNGGTPPYEHRIRLLQDDEPIFERLWGKMMGKLAEDFPLTSEVSV